MKYVLTALMAVVALVFLTAPATADFPADGYWKWIQWPNLDPTANSPSWDVTFTNPKVLADDFLCTQPMKITDVHIWFSVFGDQIGVGPNGAPDPGAVQNAIESVHLSIHKNVPETPTSPSRPGGELWADDFRSFKVAYWAQSEQGWIEPQTNEYWRVNHKNIWLLNVDIPATGAFPQTGTSAEPIIYWLDASVKLRPGVDALLGWKTTVDPQLDDAFWGHLPVPGTGGGVEWGGPLVDPVTGRSLDLAFIVTPEPGTVAMLVGAGLIGLVACARRRKKG